MLNLTERSFILRQYLRYGGADSENDMSDSMQMAVPIFPKEGTLLLKIPVNESDLDDLELMFDSREMTRKSEFHITAIGLPVAEKIRAKVETFGTGKAGKLGEIKNLWCEIGILNKWQYRLIPTYFAVEKDYNIENTANINFRGRRKSIIQMAYVPQLETLYVGLNRICGFTGADMLQPPPAHITLFTGGDSDTNRGMGIGLYSWDEFLRLDPKLLNS